MRTRWSLLDGGWEVERESARDWLRDVVGIDSLFLDLSLFHFYLVEALVGGSNERLAAVVLSQWLSKVEKREGGKREAETRRSGLALSFSLTLSLL